MFEKSQNRTVLCSNSIYAFCIACVIGLASCNSKNERPSPLRMDTTMIGNTTLIVEYSSPGVKKRDIFGIGSGYLVPYKSLWRTGANKSTSISFDSDIVIDSTLIKKGKYSIFTIPDSKTWEVILNKDADQWGSSYYRDSLDVLRVRVPISNFDKSEERMKFYFEENALKFRWATVGWEIPLSIPE